MASLGATARSAKHILAVVEASVCVCVRLSDTLCDFIQTVQARIAKSSLSYRLPQRLVFFTVSRYRSQKILAKVCMLMYASVCLLYCIVICLTHKYNMKFARIIGQQYCI